MPKFEEPTKIHSDFITKNFYKIPYPPKFEGGQSEERLYHGPLHSSRACILVSIFANLFRKYQDSQSLSLSSDDLKFVEIAALFHDAGRKDDGLDMWDEDSGLMCYNYLISTFNDSNISGDQLIELKSKAKRAAEAITNKDWSSQTDIYHELDINTQPLHWEPVSKQNKDLWATLVHEADCLDILRIPMNFEWSKLDFYRRNIGTLRNLSDFLNSPAACDLSYLIVAQRRLIHLSGEGLDNSLDLSLKESFKNEASCHNKFLSLIYNLEDETFHILRLLHNNGNLIAPENLVNLDITSISNSHNNSYLNNLMWQIDNGRMLLRGCPFPYAQNVQEENYSNLSLFEQELSICLREPGTPTESFTDVARFEELLRNCHGKNAIEKALVEVYPDLGNFSRSTSLLFRGLKPLYSCGYLLRTDPRCILEVDFKDAISGFGQKISQKSIDRNTNLATSVTLQEKFKDVFLKLRSNGANLLSFKNKYDENKYDENEFMTDIYLGQNLENFLGIYISDESIFESSLFNEVGNKYYPQKLHSELMAIFMHQTVKKLYSKDVPIYEFSCFSNFPREFRYNDQKIIDLWTSMYKSYLESTLNEEGIAPRFTEFIEVRYSNPKKLYPSLYVYEEIGMLFKFYDEALKAQVSQDMDQVRHVFVNAFISKINIKNKYGSTMLINAITYGKYQTALNLIDLGVDINLSDVLGKTPLIYSIEQNNYELVKILIELNADLNLSDVLGKTPLIYSIEQNNYELVKILIESNADINIADASGETPLIHAIKQNNYEIFELIFFENSIDLNKADATGETPLIHAIKQNNYEIFELIFFENGIDLNKADDTGETPLIHAIKRGNIAFVNMFTDYSISSINLPDSFGHTPLVHAIMENNYDIVNLLISKGAKYQLDEELITLIMKSGNKKIAEKFDVSIDSDLYDGVLHGISRKNTFLRSELKESKFEPSIGDDTGRHSLKLITTKNNNKYVLKMIDNKITTRELLSNIWFKMNGCNVPKGRILIKDDGNISFASKLITDKISFKNNDDLLQKSFPSDIEELKNEHEKYIAFAKLSAQLLLFRDFDDKFYNFYFSNKGIGKIDNELVFTDLNVKHPKIENKICRQIYTNSIKVDNYLPNLFLSKFLKIDSCIDLTSDEAKALELQRLEQIKPTNPQDAFMLLAFLNAVEDTLKIPQTIEDYIFSERILNGQQEKFNPTAKEDFNTEVLRLKREYDKAKADMMSYILPLSRKRAELESLLSDDLKLNLQDARIDYSKVAKELTQTDSCSLRDARKHKMLQNLSFTGMIATENEEKGVQVKTDKSLVSVPNQVLGMVPSNALSSDVSSASTEILSSIAKTKASLSPNSCFNTSLCTIS